MKEEIIYDKNITPNHFDEDKPKEKSKGQLFKEKTGYSKSMKRLLKKYDVYTIEEYRKIRKSVKKKQPKKIRKPRTSKKALKTIGTPSKSR